ncbi:hypothetical protein F5884DRAFT_752284 [Xylogone sp. PMI_703]|nr:hypothetical protein F5884DRAFT_752284 [Xylogone sp. PMI_703]
MSIDSQNAALAIPYGGAYSIVKTALLKFHHNLESEVKGRGVYSYYLQPGSILDRPGVVDNKSLHRVKRFRHLISQLSTCSKSSPEAVASVCIMLATHQDAPLLSGIYVDLDGNIDEILDDLRKGRDSICVQRKLYRLKVDTL